MMTVLEWLSSKTRYTFDDDTFKSIALDRGCDPDDDAYGGNVTQKQKDLMIADTIFEAVMLSPSSTPSLSQSHNGYQNTIGSETDVFQSRKIDYALAIYKKYDDEKYEILNGTIDRIKIVAIEDVMEV
jgi:hypothetical protein